MASNEEAQRLKKSGVTLPKSPDQARKEADNIKTSVTNRDLAGSMRKMSSNLQLALPKIREPMSILNDKGIPYDYSDPKELKEIRRWSRLFYATHDLVPLLVDIYSKFPTSGISLECKDPKIREFYEDMFFNTLEYDTFLQEIGREFFTVGECTTLGHFDDLLGVWSREEILNPDQLIVTRPLFQNRERILLDVEPLVDGLRPENNELDTPSSIQAERAYEYKMLQKHYPEIIEAANRGEGLELSDALVSRMVNRTSYWDLRGTPHMLRSFKTLMMEESLNAAQDAVADRLYSPFILAKLGVQNMGDGQPWIPTATEIERVRDDLQNALSADFRLMAYHFGLDITSVFGRETVPRFDSDYNRIDEKLLQAWGIGKSLISGGSGGPYASSALNREFVTQMMSSFQKYVERHMRKRMEVIAEAQGHYDYEVKGGIRKPIMQEMVQEDPETGERRIVEVPKLLIPEVKFSTLNLRDEAQERQFLQSLKGMGVPISDQSLAVNIPISFDEELEKSSDELVKKQIAQAQSMVKARKLLEDAGLPIPPEVAGFFATASEIGLQQQQMETLSEGLPESLLTEGLVEPEGPDSTDGASTRLTPEEPEDGLLEGLPRNQTRPPESDLGRPGMPRTTSLSRRPVPKDYRSALTREDVVKRVAGMSSISLEDFVNDNDLLDVFGIGQYQSDYLVDLPLFIDWLTNDCDVDEVPGGYVESYESLREALRQYGEEYQGEVTWN